MPRKNIQRPKDMGKMTPLEAARKLRKWTQEVLGDKIGRDQTYISDLENTRKIPDPDLAKKIVDQFEGEISLLDLFFAKDRLQDDPRKKKRAA